MQAVIQDRYGLPNVLSLGELAEPVPADNEFLLQVRAISLNGSDRENRMGGPASDFLRETGADRTIDFATKDWAAERNSHDLIVGLVANRSPFRVHRALRRGGRLLGVALSAVPRVMVGDEQGSVVGSGCSGASAASG